MRPARCPCGAPVRPWTFLCPACIITTGLPAERLVPTDLFDLVDTDGDPVPAWCTTINPNPQFL